MPRGNKEAYKNSYISSDQLPLSQEENTVLCQYAMEIFKGKTPCISNPEEVEKAISDYFLNCISKGLRPGNLGLYASLGLDKRQVFDILHGIQKTVNGESVNPASIEHIKKACKAMSSYREMLGAQGKLSPPVLIFWQKNYDSLTDVQQLEITSTGAPTEEKSVDELRQKMLEDMPIETEYKEL